MKARTMRKSFHEVILVEEHVFPVTLPRGLTRKVELRGTVRSGSNPGADLRSPAILPAQALKRSARVS